MEFDFSQEMKDLRDVARGFLAQKCGPVQARQVIETDGSTGNNHWREIADMGWLAATIPEEFGGLGLGHLAVCILATEIGRAIAPVPFSSSIYLATEALLLFGSPEQKKEQLPELASGQVVGTFALIERPGPFSICQTDAVVRSGLLTGTKTAVVDGSIADFAIVGAYDETGVDALYIADLSGNTVDVTELATIDPTRKLAQIHFRAHPAEILPLSTANGAIEQLLNRAAIMMAFEQLGVAQAALDMACAYAKERYAFGRPIGSFQAIKHKLADVYIANELARSNCYYGAWALDNDADDIPIAAAAARVCSGDAAWQATKENIQTHGGMGFTWAMDCHLFYRRAQLLGLSLGAASEWKRKLIGQLRERSDNAEGATC